jgi:CubicO group peptidase (beta-lactamase class C family)
MMMIMESGVLTISFDLHGPKQGKGAATAYVWRLPMKRQFSILMHLLILLALSACGVIAPSPSPMPILTGTPIPTSLVIEPDAINRLDAKLAQMTQDGTFTGSVLIAQDGKILLSKGYGLADRLKGIPNTPQTRFHLGSTTKVFTGMGILILQSQGKLSVQDPICNFFEDCPKEWQDITIHHLLTFTSGLSAQLSDQLYREIERGTSTPVTAAEKAHYLGLTSQWSLDTPPGEQYAYNNFGYILLAHIIEEVSGQSYADYLNQAIFTPLKMRNTGYPDSTSELAKLYTEHDSTIARQIATPPVSEGAGHLYSSTEDLLLWNQALYTDQLMPKPDLDRNLATYFSNGDSAGLGHGTSWFTAGGGDGSPFATFIVQSPQDRLSVIVLINQGMIDLFNIWDLIKSELF